MATDTKLSTVEIQIKLKDHHRKSLLMESIGKYCDDKYPCSMEMVAGLADLMESIKGTITGEEDQKEFAEVLIEFRTRAREGAPSFSFNIFLGQLRLLLNTDPLLFETLASVFEL